MKILVNWKGCYRVLLEKLKIQNEYLYTFKLHNSETLKL